MVNQQKSKEQEPYDSLWGGYSGNFQDFAQEEKKFMIKYVALLRGINVGGHKPVKMEELKKAFESLGFQNVKTILASGNVLFETPKMGTDILVKQIEEKLEQELGYEVGVRILKFD